MKKVLEKLFKKSKCEENNLTAAASAIVGLESKLAEKESEANGLRETQTELYQSLALGKKDSQKISKVNADLEKMLMEITGIKSVINSAKVEALDLAEMEIEDKHTYKTKLQEQMKQETTAENKKIIVSTLGLLTAIFKIHGIRGSISKDVSLRLNIPTDSMSEKDIAKANEKLLAFYEKTDTGPHFLSEQIRKIDEQTAKADPKKAVEKALQDARAELAQNKTNKKAA